MTVKQKIEGFLKSNYYLIAVMALIFIGWHVKSGPTLFGMNFLNAIVMILLIVIWAFIVISYDNMAYGLPLILGFSYLINTNDLNLKTIVEMIPLMIAGGLFIFGIVIHIIRYGKGFKRGRLTLGLTLMALASLIPLLYVDFSWALLILSLVGIFHIVGYTIFDNYAKIDLGYFFRLIYALSWLLIAQMWSRYFGYLLSNGLASFPNGIRDSWSGYNNMGWGVINDVFIHLLLMIPVHIYYIIKRPQRFGYWMGLLFVGVTFAISGSRGGVMGLLIAIPFMVFVILRYGNRQVRINLLLFTVVFVGVAIASSRYIGYIIDGFKASLENDYSTGRLYLWKWAVEVFKVYPLFGGGWAAQTMRWGSDMRTVVYHSTFFHTIAVMGLFGLVAVIINWWESFIIMCRKISLEKWIVLIGFIGSQSYGLVDITQHAAFYMILLTIQLLVIEKSPVRTKQTFDDKDMFFVKEKKLAG